MPKGTREQSLIAGPFEMTSNKLQLNQGTDFRDWAESQDTALD